MAATSRAMSHGAVPNQSVHTMADGSDPDEIVAVTGGNHGRLWPRTFL